MNSLKVRCLTMALLVAGASLQGGCATFLNDDNQMVAFNTEPDGAKVKIDGVAMGHTPVVLPVPRKGGDKVVTFELAGYKTVNYELRNQLNGALAGNLIFGGLIGLGVDAISGRGGGYQKDVSVLLEPGHGSVTMGTDADPKREKPQADKSPSYW